MKSVFSIVSVKLLSHAGRLKVEGSTWKTNSGLLRVYMVDVQHRRKLRYRKTKQRPLGFFRRGRQHNWNDWA